MIDRTLAPPAIGGQTDVGHILQSLMFSYLASYSSGAVDTSTHQSYTRAWGINAIAYVPRVVGGRPGFVMTQQSYPWGYHVTIAIEGSVAYLRQTFSWTNGANGFVPVPGCEGHVWATVKQYADEIKAAALATPIGATITSETTYTTFTGYSLGAAVAEVLACLWQAEAPRMRNYVHKFACPRFCTHEWFRQRNTAIRVRGYYHAGDPVIYVPMSGQMDSGDGFFHRPIGVTGPLAWDDDAQVINLRGEPVSRYWTTDQLTGWHAMQMYAWWLRDMTPANPWHWHKLDSYRLAAMHYAAQDRDQLEMRVNYLSHPDENNWQFKFRPGALLASMTKEVLEPDPDEFSVWSSSQIRETHMAVPATTQPPQPLPAPIQDVPDWSIVDPITSQFRSGRRHHLHRAP